MLVLVLVLVLVFAAAITFYMVVVAGSVTIFVLWVLPFFREVKQSHDTPEWRTKKDGIQYSSKQLC